MIFSHLYELFFLATLCEVLSKPSISAEKLQSLVEAFENTGGDAAGVRYLCLGTKALRLRNIAQGDLMVKASESFKKRGYD